MANSVTTVVASAAVSDLYGDLDTRANRSADVRRGLSAGREDL